MTDKRNGCPAVKRTLCSSGRNPAFTKAKAVICLLAILGVSACLPAPAWAAGGNGLEGAVIDEVLIVGLSRTRPEVVARQLPFAPGDTWRESYRELTIERLSATNLFDPMSLRVTAEPAESGGVRVIVRASDPHPLYLDPIEFAAVHAQELLYNRFNQTIHNPFGDGTNLIVGKSWGGNDSASVGATRSLRDGWILRAGIDWSNTTRRFYPLEAGPRYDSIGVSARIAADREASTVWSYGGALSFTEAEIALDGQAAEEQAWLQISPYLSYHRGIDLDIGIRLALDFTGNFDPVAGITGRLEKRFPGTGGELIAALHAGCMTPDAPLNQIFVIGGFGAAPLRGHSAAFAGHAYATGTVEYRRRLGGKGVWGIVFLDAGTIRSHRQPGGAYPPVVDLGAGLAVDTPMGYPVRLDFARGIAEDGAGWMWNLGLDFDF